jgi:hypothetical protein
VKASILVRGAWNVGRFDRLAKQAEQAAEEGRAGNRTGKTHMKVGIQIRQHTYSSKLDVNTIQHNL